MKIEDSIKQDLKSSEHSVNFSSLPLKNPHVSFLPEKIYCDSQGHSSHPKLHIASMGRQPTNCTVQSKHSPANPQPRFDPIPQTTRPDTSKKQMTMRFHAMPAENTSRIKRDEPQPVTCSKFAQDSQPENEIVLRQGPLFPNHLIPWDNKSNRSKEVICMAKERANSRRPPTHQGYARL